MGMEEIMKKKAIFLDRDGVLIKDNHLMTSLEQVEVLPGADEALKLFHDMGHLIFILSNQSVVARGMVTQEQCHQLHQDILQSIKYSDLVRESYLCPYHPDAQEALYRQEHPWRKPNPGALKHWIDKYGINPHESYMVGDRETDMECGRAVKCRTVGIGKVALADECFSSLLEFAISLRAKT